MSSESLFNSDTDLLIIGVIYIALSAVVFPIYAVIISVSGPKEP